MLDAGSASVHITFTMTDAVKAHDAKYAAFAARMLLALAAEEADIAARDTRFSTRQIGSTANSTDATVRPSK